MFCTLVNKLCIKGNYFVKVTIHKLFEHDVVVCFPEYVFYVLFCDS